MTGYIGSAADAAQELAMDAVNNSIHAIREQMRSSYGDVSLKHCLECGDEIHPKRREILPGVRYCINCQDSHMFKTNYKMLTKML